MNTFLVQAQTEIKSEEFQAEAKLAMQFVAKLAKVIFLVLVGLGLSAYIAGVRSKRLFNYIKGLYFPQSAQDNLNVIFENNVALAKVLLQIKSFQVYSILFIQSTYNQLANSLQPVISFVKGLLSNGNSTSINNTTK